MVISSPDSIDPDISGAVATLDEVVTELYGTATIEEAIAESEKATLVKTLTDAIEGVVTEQGRQCLWSQQCLPGWSPRKCPHRRNQPRELNG